MTPPDARQIARHQTGLRVLHDDAHTHLARAATYAQYDPAADRISIYLPSSDSEQARLLDLYLMLTFGLVLLLQGRGLFPIHAAALAPTMQSEPRGRRGVLVIAASDSGKSTLTMNLVRAGWHFLSDDSVLLFQDTDSAAAAPFRRDFALDQDTADLFPEVGDHSVPVLTDPYKRRVDIDSVHPDRRIESCIPRVLIFPTIVEGGPSALIPLDKRDALLRVLSEASFLATGRILGGRHLDLLRQLVEQSKCFRLLAARDIKTDASRASQLLSRALAASEEA